MELLIFGFTHMQIAGLILMVVMLPLLFNTLYILSLANKSKLWPKVKGNIVTVYNYVSSREMFLEYCYQIQGKEYKNKRIFFTNSNHYERKSAREFEKKYSEGQEVEVYYNPNKHSTSVIEPGRKDGVLVSILLTVIFFLFGYIAFFDQELFTEITEKLFQLFS
ncbi:DUF3592 domain-containing protein [Confluentibacter sediminis]|uniref:DUF3592 domain-containing protein n=1 Tax=Confluentibacter sediminis TaxID=2219045 RepID=UPI000DAB87E8|nr:DUF3592 domain-containing protein [Confluentibacter sediminis]